MEQLKTIQCIFHTGKMVFEPTIDLQCQNKDSTDNTFGNNKDIQAEDVYNLDETNITDSPLDTAKQIPAEQMKDQMVNTADTIFLENLAPPTRYFMLWSQMGSVKEMFGSPSHHVRKDTLLQIYHQGKKTSRNRSTFEDFSMLGTADELGLREEDTLMESEQTNDSNVSGDCLVDPFFGWIIDSR